MEKQPVNHTPRIFKKIVPDKLFWDIFSLVGITGVSSTQYFKKSIITQEVCKKFYKYKDKLKECYQKHKHFVLEREMNATRFIQILRQMAKCKGYCFQSKEYVEKLDNYPKRLMYRLICRQDIPLTQFKESEFTVGFD